MGTMPGATLGMESSECSQPKASRQIGEMRQ
jgi:hypothetical protein